MPPKISVILPAVNEEDFIERAIVSINNQKYPHVEIIVLANNSTDTTVDLSVKAGARVVEYSEKLGPSGARNAGAKHATGDILVFFDSDGYLGDGVLAAINDAVLSHKVRGQNNILGTVMGGPIEKEWLYHFFFMIKNVFHRFGLYKGALGGLMFFDKETFQKIRGYKDHMNVDEIYDISKRARQSGAKYILIPKVYAYTSMRRFKKHGPIRMGLFWCKVRLMNLFRKKKVEDEEYWTV